MNAMSLNTMLQATEEARMECSLAGITLPHNWSLFDDSTTKALFDRVNLWTNYGVSLGFTEAQAYDWASSKAFEL